MRREDGRHRRDKPYHRHSQAGIRRCLTSGRQPGGDAHRRPPRSRRGRRRQRDARDGHPRPACVGVELRNSLGQKLGVPPPRPRDALVVAHPQDHRRADHHRDRQRHRSARPGDARGAGRDEFDAHHPQTEADELAGQLARRCGRSDDDRVTARGDARGDRQRKVDVDEQTRDHEQRHHRGDHPSRHPADDGTDGERGHQCASRQPQNNLGGVVTGGKVHQHNRSERDRELSRQREVGKQLNGARRETRPGAQRGADQLGGTARVRGVGAQPRQGIDHRNHGHSPEQRAQPIRRRGRDHGHAQPGRLPRPQQRTVWTGFRRRRRAQRFLRHRSSMTQRRAIEYRTPTHSDTL